MTSMRGARVCALQLHTDVRYPSECARESRYKGKNCATERGVNMQKKKVWCTRVAKKVDGHFANEGDVIKRNVYHR